MTDTLVTVVPSDAKVLPSTDAPSLGRTRITQRALSRIVVAIVADTLGIETGAVNVDLGDDHGLLALTISAPIRVVSLTRIQRDATLLTRTGGPLLERAAHAQATITERVTALTGSRIGHVTIRLTGTRIRIERRVR
ncbi:hypothetical protein [Rathayibacter soli]|uniref:hypothetical protein n=1 Tax=Rathayibacter soli TaxID=3144168 RepID=UPI0027E49C88|nr:hypothetical protein [Glaciibacter superstes]